MIPDNFIGRQLGDFVIRERIGEGGMATVYRAYQGSMHRDVALKIIYLGSANQASETFRLRFEREAELVASLEHIHILPVYDYGITEDAAYLAMRLLRGGTLAELLRNAPLEIGVATDLFQQFANGLRYAHNKGVIHRDLKPANIMLDDSGNALLADFGLAKLIVEPLPLTQSGTVVGTPSYMSPEQVLGKPLDPRSDIYSAGVVLYHMLTGQLPFENSTNDLSVSIFQQLHAEPRPPSQLNPAISPVVQEVVLRAMRKNREERYQTIGVMAVELDRALGRRVSLTDARLESLVESEAPEASPSPPGGTTNRDTEHASGVGRANLQAEGGTPNAPRASVPARHRIRLSLAIAALVVVAGTLVLLALTGKEPTSQRWPTAPTVRAGESDSAAGASPSNAEIALARKQLGTNGFIAYVTCTERTEYHAGQAREMADFAARAGLAYRVYDSDGDTYRQLTQIEKARVEGARGLIVCPLNARLLVTPLESARSSRIPLVLMASGMPSYGGVIIAGDDYEMGLKAGVFAGDIVAREMGGKANVVILDYPELPNLVRRAEGMQRGLHERAPGARIVGHARGGTREFAAESVRELIARGRSFNVLLSINDAGSFGAIAAMERAGFAPGSVLISSVDAEALAREYIRKGEFIRGSVATDREKFSNAAMGAMVKLLAGSTVAEEYVVAPGPVVTRSILEKGTQ